MQSTSQPLSDPIRFAPPLQHADYAHTSLFLCNWHILRKQLLGQWALLSSHDLDATGADCRRIAELIADKYGILPGVVENYLRNFERTLPLL